MTFGTHLVKFTFNSVLPYYSKNQILSKSLAAFQKYICM